MPAWLDQRIKAIRSCLDAGFAEAALVLLYSGIDTLAFLRAAPEPRRSSEMISSSGASGTW